MRRNPALMMRIVSIVPAAVRAAAAGGVTALGLLVVAATVAVGEDAAAPPEFFLGGIQVNERDHGRWVDSLRAVGMNTVEVTVYAHQGDWDSDHLWYSGEEPAVLDEIRAAKSRGLAVVLVLRVALDHAFPRNKFLWHGQIMPSTDEALRSWFEQYGTFVTRWAAVSEAEGVDVLAIGSELKALTGTVPIGRKRNVRDYYGFYWYQRFSRKRARRFADEIQERNLWVRGYDNYDSIDLWVDDRFRHNMDWARQAYLRDRAHTLARINERRRRLQAHWEQLIVEAREVYRGRLTYAANFDHYHDVGFWPSLDMVGINAYFSLRDDVTEELDAEEMAATFERSWTRILSEIEAVKVRQGVPQLPVLFTELGYTFRRHSTVEPWAHEGFSVVGWKGHKRGLVVWADQPVDYDERAIALRSLHAAWLRTDRDLAGLLYWKLSTDRGHEAIEPFVIHVGPDSADPAQEALRRFVAGKRR